MNQKQNRLNPPDTTDTQKDWFAPTMASRGTVADSLHASELKLNAKLAFLNHLRQHLQPDTRSQYDTVTELQLHTKKLEKSLEYRLGLLNADRPGAWFRDFVVLKNQPFSKGILTEPVISTYELEDIEQIKSDLKRSFSTSQQFGKVRNFSSCLWLSLINLKIRHQSLLKPSVKFKNFNFYNYNGLPEDIQSPSLFSFINNIAASLRTTETILDQCYDRLYDSSSKLWVNQKKAAELYQRVNSPNYFEETARKVRSNFQKRRKTQHGSSYQQKFKRLFSNAEIKALDYFGFKVFPDMETLRKSYHALAQKLHPDMSQQNSEDHFRTLVANYNILKDAIELKRI